MFFNPAKLNQLQKKTEPIEHLPFIVKQVTHDKDMEKAISVRHNAYARHIPELSEKLSRPEPIDTQNGVAILLAQSKIDERPLGTVRIQTNRFGQLALEQSIQLPATLQSRSLAHISRLAIDRGIHATLVKHMLFKGLYHYWVANHIDWAIVAARRPLDRMYEQLQFLDVYPGGDYLPLAHMGNLGHRIMAFEVATAFERWHSSSHPLTQFVFHTRHPDLLLPGSD